MDNISMIRQEMAVYGESSVSYFHILAILLGVETASKIQKKFPTARTLSQASLQDMLSVPEVGQATAMRIKAALQLGQRAAVPDLNTRAAMSNSETVASRYMALLGKELREKFFAVLLDTKHKIMREELVSIGSLNFSIVHPREVFAPAIKERAGSIILVHNHPSGDVEPSQDDIKLTRRLVEVGEVVGIEILDHVIVSATSFCSFAERRLL